MANSSGAVNGNRVAGIALVEEAREQLALRRPSCTADHARERIQIGIDVGNCDVARLWRAVLARVVEAQAWS